MMEMEKERRSRERPLRSSSAAMGATQQQQQRERPTRTVVAPVAARESRQKEVVAVIAREVRQKEVQVLRKKNQELTDITRKLEEKVKSLEQKTKEASQHSINKQQQLDKEKGPRTNLAARQREKEAEVQRQLHFRDKEIFCLKERLRDVSRRLALKDVYQPAAPKLKEKIATIRELESIIVLTAKERMELERQLAVTTEALKQIEDVELPKYKALEQTNQLLKAQLQELDRITQQYKIIQLQLEEKNEECENLTLRLKAKSELCQDLENQLARVIDKNTELTIQNSDLQRQIQELQRLSQECDSLRKSLSNTEAEYDSAQEEVEKLRSKISHLETVLQKMREAAETRRDLETEHAETIQQLKEKREEISRLARASDLERDRNAAAVDRLQAKVFELEKRTLLQNAKQEELAKELEAARRRRAPDIHDQNGNFRNLQAPLLQLDTSVGGDRFGLLENGRSQRIVSKPSPDSGIGSPEALKESFAGITLSANGTAGLSFVTPTDHGVLMRKQNGHVANGALGVTNNRQGLDTAVPSQLVMAALEQHRGLLQHQAMSQLHTHVARPATVISPVLGTDFMDVPGRGRCSVFIARYSYDPFMQSPNDNPESELPLTAGDYVLVWGDVDEDGFFDGELLTGRRGSVPSNFVERVTGNELCGLHKALLAGVMDAAMDDGTINNKSALTNGLVRSTLSSDALSDFEQMLDDEIDADDDEVSDVPAPRMLVVERQLSNSVLIAWAAPAATDSRSVDCYRVFVDGDLQLTIGANERLKALLEGIDPARSHRISIRSVSLSKMSTEASCTMLVGRRVTSVPTRIRVSDVTSASALVTWLPANSNFSHVVRVNNVEVGTVKPGIYRHPVSGLAQNTDYTVSVRAKHETAVGEEARGGSDDTGCPVASISFVTLPKAGLPDPPVNVQVEPGPQDGTLLVTWLPVTIINSGTSNGAPVTGYAVFLDGQKVCDVGSPTGDHAVIDLSLLMRDVNVSSPNAPKQVTVKTKSKEGLSGDSVPALLTLPLVLAASVTANGRLRIANSGSSKGGLDQSLGDMTERSELSDIAEEPEESLSSSCSSSPSMDPIVSQQRNEIFEANNLPSQSAPGQKSSSGSGASSSPSAAAAFGSPDNGAASAAVSTENVADLRRTTQRRLFIATYDYDPATQSPNVDFSAELPFHQGDLITVLGDKDPDGFYLGSANGREGLVPGNMVKEVQVEDDSVVNDGSDRSADIYDEMPVRRMIAAYDYNPVESSPNADADAELAFRCGEQILVFGEMDDDGFFVGELNGRRGLVPSNFLVTDADSGLVLGSSAMPAGADVAGVVVPAPAPAGVGRTYSDSSAVQDVTGMTAVMLGREQTRMISVVAPAAGGGGATAAAAAGGVGQHQAHYHSENGRSTSQKDISHRSGLHMKRSSSYW